jgi:hypothetical protein
MGPTTVSWVPLAPGEIYYGYRHYGPHSVVVNRNVHIERNVYINAKVKDAVVTIPKDHFLKPGKREPIRVIHTGNPFVGKGKVSGPPTEKPVQIGERRVPPRPVKESKEFKERTIPERKVTPKEQKGEPSPKVDKAVNKGPNDSSRGREPIRDKVEKGGQLPQQPRSIPTSPPVREKARPQDRSIQQQRQEKAVERGSSPNRGREEKKVESPGPVQRGGNPPEKINRNGGNERSRGGITTKSTPSQPSFVPGPRGLRL